MASDSMASDSHGGLSIRSLSFDGFRNYRSFELRDIGSLTILVGNNGVGKTNVLEGVQLMTSASSFRHPHVAELIREGGDFARVEAELSDGNRRLSMSLLLEPGKKRYTVNGKAKGAADVRGVLPAVTFAPDDLNLAKKSSSVKRDALDDLGIQLSRNYDVLRRDYEKTVRYKNRLLKDEASRALVESINETLVTCGSQLFCYRRALFGRMVPLIASNYASIAEGSSEEFSATYVPSWEHVAGTGDPDVPAAADTEELPRDRVRELLYDALDAHYEEERARHRSLVGPHNDKIGFYLAGRDASSFASQGQQRSIVLAWKLAEVEMTRLSLGTSPVLLLDDVMSELDATRRDMLVRFVTDDIQTFMTATDLGAFNETLLGRARVVRLPVGVARDRGA